MKRLRYRSLPVVPSDDTVLAMVRSAAEGYEVGLIAECYNVKRDTLYRYLTGRLRQDLTGYTTTDNHYTRHGKPRRKGYQTPHFHTLWKGYKF